VLLEKLGNSRQIRKAAAARFIRSYQKTGKSAHIEMGHDGLR
jgi:hypothetical protein